MACAAIWLNSSPLSDARFIPFLYRRSDFDDSTGSPQLPLFHTEFSTRFRHPVMAVRAQARRGFSMKEDEVASPSDIHFEAPPKIVEYPDPLLRAKNKRIETFDDNLKKFVDEMFDIMYKSVNCEQYLLASFSTELMALVSPHLKLGSMFNLWCSVQWVKVVKERRSFL